MIYDIFLYLEILGILTLALAIIDYFWKLKPEVHTCTQS